MWLIFGNIILPGQLLTLTFYSFFIFGPLQEIGNIIITYREAEASLANFHNLMIKAPEKKPDSPHNFGNIVELEFKNVKFKHQTANQPALNNINFNVKSGETIAFVGPSGSGISKI